MFLKVALAYQIETVTLGLPKASKIQPSTIPSAQIIEGRAAINGMAGGRIWLKGYSCQMPNQRKQGRWLDSGNKKLGLSLHYQLKQSLFESDFKVTSCRFRDLTL